ncbi:MAG: hypothetical protein PVI42_20715, partial [Desulfobacterales bacterium]
MPSCLPSGNAGELQILRCQGFEVTYYDVTLDALTLKPFDVCNIGVTSTLSSGAGLARFGIFFDKFNDLTGNIFAGG